MNKKYLEQLGLAKEAGTKAMAKDFFAPAPGQSDPASEALDSGKGEPNSPGEVMADDAQPLSEGTPGVEGATAEGEMSPEDLEELLRMMGAAGTEDTGE